MTIKKAYLALANGTVFEGRNFGADGEASGEVVFNTSMTGYQEILTDASYRGQIVTMTYPHIGNYGINYEDVESSKPHLSGFIIRELSRYPSNWRSRKPLDDYLKDNGIVAIQGIDTRALTRILREQGSQEGIISTEDSDPGRLVEKARTQSSIIGRDLVSEVTCKKPYTPALSSSHKSLRKNAASFKVIVYDFGVKWNIIRMLEMRGCAVTVVPASTTAEDVLSMDPDGILLSNGPGDPENASYAISSIRKLLNRKPIFGICFGHQILGLALGGKTYKLRFGHHGGNQPVMDMLTKKVEITAQNHNFAVDMDSMGSDVDLTHMNLNDQTVEGMRHRQLPVFSVQYHPEASPGPHDSWYLFERFIEVMKRRL